MKVKVQPGWSSSGKDHHIKDDGYMVLDVVVPDVYLDGELVEPEHDRFYRVQRIEDHSPDAIHLYS